VRAIARRDWGEAARVVLPPDDVASMGAEVREAARIEAELQAFFAEHQAIRVDPEARSPKHLDIQDGAEGEHTWRVRQTLLDPEGDNDWFVEMTVDLARSRELARPVLTLGRFAR